MTRTISAAEFKATCLDLLDRVAETGLNVVITKRGRPVARVVPMVNKPRLLVGAMKDEIEIRGDIISPLPLRWNALGGGKRK
jgi:prevent-host-death family protein